VAVVTELVLSLLVLLVLLMLLKNASDLAGGERPF
jgi:hypothetical protein